MMELSYTQHYSTAAAAGHDAHSPPAATEAPSCPESSSSDGGAAPVDITFTATASASGSLLIGKGCEAMSPRKPACYDLHINLIAHKSHSMVNVPNAPMKSSTCHIAQMSQAG